MAEVYLARRRAAGIEKWLVVKRMRPERSGDARFLDLFVREARLSMSLVHQNIVPVFDFGRIDDQVFLAMERVEGKDLGSSLARAPGHRLPPLLAAFVAAECCQALDYAHQRKSPEGVALGIVHRDVTPRNVLLSWSGEVKLTDFGIAALAGDATSRLLGTPQYMAPEQARGEPIDPRADIYAIGLVLREAVSGVRPRPGSDRETILDAARKGELLPWPVLSAPGSAQATEASHPEPPPATLIAIIDRATAADPGDRYPDVRSMLEELDNFIVGQRAAHKAESPARQLAAWLAGIWESERDDAETDAAIEAEHLVSFLDDGAFDVIGTGTIRSLAATAADDAPQGPMTPAGPGTPSELGGSSGPSVSPSPSAPRPTDRATQLGTVSSSNSTVASGSFHTIPATGAGAAAGRLSVRRRTSRQMRGVASILFAALAAGTVLVLVTNNRSERGGPSNGETHAGGPTERSNTTQPTADQPNAGQRTEGLPHATQPNAGQSTADQPNTGQPNAGQPLAGQPNAAQPSADRPNVGQPTAGQSTTGQSNAGQPNAGQPNVGQSNAGQPNAGQPHTGQPHTGQPHTGAPHNDHAGSGQPNPDTRYDGSGSAKATSGDGSHRAKPAMCQVRINLTPWAYYAAEDGSRHETPSTIELAPGPHRIHVWNPELHVERDITINVPTDRDTMNFSEPLQPTASSPDADPRPQP
jgi:serine/threonine protein kinase